MYASKPYRGALRHLMIVRTTYLSILSAALTLATVFLPTQFVTAQTSESCPCVSDFAAASDVNCDGLPLSVADYVFLMRVVFGDTIPDSTCVGELDGYRNSFSPCRPGAGDTSPSTAHPEAPRTITGV